MRLHEQVTELRRQRDDALEQIEWFRQYLLSEKFSGHHPQDGSPNNWINTTEAMTRLGFIKSALEGN